MCKVELVYFVGCPNIEQAKSVILAAGVAELIEIDLSTVDTDHPYQQYSSPTILMDGEIVAGSKNGGAACSIIDWTNVSSGIKSEMMRCSRHTGRKLKLWREHDEN